MTDAQWNRVVQGLDARGIMPKRIPSLERFEVALQEMRRLFPRGCWEGNASTTVVVAGTNGKGSVCATLSRLFFESGKRVGFYSSPHLVELTERVRVQEQMISKEIFRAAYERLEPLFDRMGLSHFECLTALAHWIFRSGELIEPVEIEVLEVGMGGVWDATNAIPHRFCGIAKLAYDHERWLGATLPEIARNKLGIIPENEDAQVVHLPWPTEVEALAQETMQRTRAHFHMAYPGEGIVHFPRTSWQAPWGESIPLSLVGRRALENTGLAVKLFEVMGGNAQAVATSVLPHVNWPGRLSLWQRAGDYGMRCPTYLSGDHNPSGVESLVSILETLEPDTSRTLWLVAGFGEERDLAGMTEAFQALHDRIRPLTGGVNMILTEIPYRPRRIGDYGRLAEAALFADPNWRRAVTWIAERAQPHDLCIVTGSLYLVGDLLI